MKQIGLALIILGLLLMIFDIAGCQGDGRAGFLDWVGNWGQGPAWGIRIGMVVIGFILVFSGNKKAK